MKNKIVKIVALVALALGFLAPMAMVQEAWAEGTLYSFCYSKSGSLNSDGTRCTYQVSSRDECSGGSFTAPSSSSQGKMYCTITVGGGTVDSQLTEGSSTIDQTEATKSGVEGSGTSGSSKATSTPTASTPDMMDKTCGENQVYTSIIGGEGCTDVGTSGEGIFTVLSIILNVLTYGVGIAGVLGIVISGVQYLTARDNEQQMAKAKSRIINVVIGLAAYAVMWAFLQWLLPGGVLNGS